MSFTRDRFRFQKRSCPSKTVSPMPGYFSVSSSCRVRSSRKAFAIASFFTSVSARAKVGSHAPESVHSSRKGGTLPGHSDAASSVSSWELRSRISVKRRGRRRSGIWQASNSPVTKPICPVSKAHGRPVSRRLPTAIITTL